VSISNWAGGCFHVVCAKRKSSGKQDGYYLRSDPQIKVDARAFKMSKSRDNVVNPDDIVRDYGADCFRLYEMYMGPLEQQKPWKHPRHRWYVALPQFGLAQPDRRR